MIGFEVIASECDRAGNVIFGTTFHRKVYPGLPEAYQVAASFKYSRRTVVIRPNFNEDGFYREWRSINGKPWTECRWSYP